MGEFLRAAERELVDWEGGRREVRRVEGKVGYEVIKEDGRGGAFTWVKRERVWRKEGVE